MPGAKIPAAMKIPIAGVQNAENGTKNGVTNHKTPALIDSEMKDPVIAFDSTKPRRMKI